VLPQGPQDRHVPLGGNTAALLNAYLAEHASTSPAATTTRVRQPAPEQAQPRRDRLDHPKYQARPATRHSSAPTSARQYCAMQGHAPLRGRRAVPYIRDILGHVDLSTTGIYARASTEANAKPLEAACTDIVTELPNGTRTPDCSAARQTVSPSPSQRVNDPVLGMRSAGVCDQHAALGDTSTAHNPLEVKLTVWRAS